MARDSQLHMNCQASVIYVPNEMDVLQGLAGAGRTEWNQRTSPHHMPGPTSIQEDTRCTSKKDILQMKRFEGAFVVSCDVSYMDLNHSRGIHEAAASLLLHVISIVPKALANHHCLLYKT
jgi:hypothetical protein